MNIQQFVESLNAKFSSEGYSFTVEQGPKYARVVRSDSAQRSVFCFVTAAGEVLKAAGWKGPAKGIRADLATLDINRVDVYGGWLYR